MESETEEEWDPHLDEEETEKRSAVMAIQGWYAIVDERLKSTDEVSRGDDKRVCIDEQLPEVSPSTSKKHKWTIRKVVALSKQLAMVDPIENTTPQTTEALTVPHTKVPALHTGGYKVLRSCILDYTILAYQERETSDLTFWLLPKATTLPVPNHRQLRARTPAAPMQIGIAHISAICSLKDDTRYTENQDAKNSPTVLGRIHRHTVPMLIDGGSGICVTSEEVTRELNIAWKCTAWLMMTADVNRFDLTNVAISVPVNVDGVVTAVPIIEAKSGSEQVILRRPSIPYTWMCEWNVDNGSCKITISAINGTGKVMFVITSPGDRRVWFASSWGCLYT